MVLKLRQLGYQSCLNECILKAVSSKSAREWLLCINGVASMGLLMELMIRPASVTR